MCGIAGEFAFDDEPVTHDSVKLMTDALIHRGPDEGAVRLLGPGVVQGRACVGLGHRRLKVIDLTSAAAQPMRDPLDRGCLVYNGELYNAPELRRELEGRGVRFRSRSDTEVVLMALLTFAPEEALLRFNGMFALAFWDAARARLILARDRFGEKPLYYARTPGRLLFASEIEALAAQGDVPLDVDDEAVELFLTLGYIPAPWSIYRAIRKLPHASCLAADASGLHGPWRYYRLEERLRRSQAPPPGEAVRAALESAVRRRLESDVPLGAFLSGGIDSSAVVTFMRRALAAAPHTYSVAVPDNVFLDEAPMARRLAGELGTVHREIAVDAAALQGEIPQALGAFGEPFADSSAIPCSLIAREARRTLTVALSGDGGDEVFGGYRLYRALAFARHLERIGAPGRTAAAALLRGLPARQGGGFAGLVHRGRKLLDGLSDGLAATHAAWASIIPGDARADLRPAARDQDLARSLFEERQTRFGGGIDSVLAVEMDLSLPDDMLAKVDRTSMRHALEIRAPFLDPEVVEMALALPARAHFTPRAGKRLLRQALRGTVPDRVLDAPKRGFEVPVGDWLAGPLAALWRERVAAADLPGVFGVDARVALDWHEEHVRRRADRGRALWALLVLSHWQDSVRPAHSAAAAQGRCARSIYVLGAGIDPALS
jgi:asparagine synthase (glutamine-hydrolysing)